MTCYLIIYNNVRVYIGFYKIGNKNRNFKKVLQPTTLEQVYQNHCLDLSILHSIFKERYLSYSMTIICIKETTKIGNISIQSFKKKSAIKSITSLVQIWISFNKQSMPSDNTQIWKIRSLERSSLTKWLYCIAICGRQQKHTSSFFSASVECLYWTTFLNWGTRNSLLHVLLSTTLTGVDQ